MSWVDLFGQKTDSKERAPRMFEWILRGKSLRRVSKKMFWTLFMDDPHKPKAMNALAKGVPIVEPRYFSDLLSAVETKQSLPGK